MFILRYFLCKTNYFFVDEQVNSMAFQYLTDDMIHELIPRIGRRAIFRHKYIEFKRREDKNVSKNLRYRKETKILIALCLCSIFSHFYSSLSCSLFLFSQFILENSIYGERSSFGNLNKSQISNHNPSDVFVIDESELVSFRAI